MYTISLDDRNVPRRISIFKERGDSVHARSNFNNFSKQIFRPLFSNDHF